LTVTIPPEGGNSRRSVAFFRSWLFAVAAIVIVVALPATIGAARRNLAYLRLLHGDAGGGASSGDDLFVLRGSLQRGDWMTAERMLLRTARPDRLAPLLVLHEADRRVKARDLEGGRAALALVSAQAGRDPALWYRVGEIYERAGAAGDAVAAHARGSASDPAAPWTYGRYRMAMIHQHEKNWQGVLDLLAPLMTAPDDVIARNVDTSQIGGTVWQEAFVALGEAYRQLGRAAEAEASYDRVARIAAPRRDWTLNRALVFLAAAKRARGDYPSALEAARRALDVATEFDASYRQKFELDTAAEADRLIDQARREKRLDALNAPLEEMVRRTPESPGAWYLHGLASEASCDVAKARADYGRAAALVRPGTGAFLAGRPADPARGPCPAR
jgi:tetratricopeptide (TPR) repeat protein